jgi:hypothetical protein
MHCRLVNKNYKILVVNPQWKREFGGPMHRWKDKNEMDLTEIEYGSVNWVEHIEGKAQWQSVVMNVIILCIP